METTISFEDITFIDEKKHVKGIFMQRFHFYLDTKELENIASYTVKEGSLIFSEREKRVWNKFTPLLDKGLNTLRSSMYDKDCLYIHEGSGIPLIGSNEFGIIDRGSNILEIKPLTGCNLNCSFCSVDEGITEKTDIIVQVEYLIKEFSKIAAIKKHPVEANIGPQGEPLLYPKLVALVKGLKEHGATIISMNTNGTLLTEKLIDELANAGLDRINLSLHALNQELEKKLMGGVQNVTRLQKMIAYCAGKIDILLAPVLMAGLNDSELDGLITLAKTIKNNKWPSIGIQNFLTYPGGRNPGIIERKWEEFFAILEAKEKEHNINLTLKGCKEVFEIMPDKSLEKPFKKGEFIDVTIVAKGRNKDEWLGVAQERVVSVRSCKENVLHKQIKIKLLRDKHNIFTGIPS